MKRLLPAARRGGPRRRSRRRRPGTRRRRRCTPGSSSSRSATRPPASRPAPSAAARSRTRAATRSTSPPRSRRARPHAGLDVHAVEQPVRSRHEEVRRLLPGGDHHRPAEEDRRLHLVVPEREPGRAHLEADDAAEEHRRPEEAPDVRPDEHDGPRLDHDTAASGQEAADVSDDDRRVPGGAAQPVPGDDPRRADRRARAQVEPDEVRPGRRTDRHARAVRRGAPEGLQAAPARRRADRRS